MQRRCHGQQGRQYRRVSPHRLLGQSEFNQLTRQPFAELTAETMGCLHEILSVCLGVRQSSAPSAFSSRTRSTRPWATVLTFWKPWKPEQAPSRPTRRKGSFLPSCSSPTSSPSRTATGAPAACSTPSRGALPRLRLTAYVEIFKNALLLFYAQSICLCFKELLLEAHG